MLLAYIYRSITHRVHFLDKASLGLVHLRQKFAHRCQAPAQRRTLGVIPFFSPSLGDCLGAPNSRWRWASVALPLCGQACEFLRGVSSNATPSAPPRAAAESR